ncbi:MAG: zinc metallopeptidase [Fretibacterium sp.]|uniref:zinc metallopeptidase n=1 Tax=Fretibacterium sp. OH1220_COT-178 TaxID=2491047 RepID=UPI000F5F563E|nr:zinc metallopeptidase [Fretibacterium sp. OH1220_COT-178]MDO4785559.1 zinc metallopeptidase [Fretibacterium sp.]RRD64082.1 zinc metallopeptidase [Fretibacterium sp. OH1220_COT-178]
MYYPFFDPTMILVLPALLLSLWAQFRVKSTFDRFSRVRSSKGVTGAQVARMLLDRFGLSSVPVDRVAGALTDHYNPRDRTLHLSDSVYSSSSIAAIGVAAHEVGHAIQHSEGYAPLMFRNRIAPAVGLVSNMAIPLFFIGFLMRGQFLMNLGIVLFLGAIVFHLVTLPVEYNASSRAISILNGTGALSPDELKGARSVLNAAAWTYVAAALMAVLQLVRLLVLRNSRER